MVGLSPFFRFYIVTKGEVEVLLEEPGGQQIVVARLHSGQYFGEIGLLRGGARIATVRACPTSAVEVVTLDKKAFQYMMSSSAETRDEVSRLAGQRAAETETKRNGK